METKTASLIIGVIFLLVGLLGFIPNPLFGEHDALFHTDTVHNMVHIVSGVLFLVFALFVPQSASLFMKIFGVIYFLLGVMGLLNIGSEGTTTLLGFLHVNGADNYLHIALGVIIFLAGMMKPR